MLEKIEKFLETIDISMLSLEELEHYTNICIMLENKHLADLERKSK